MFTELMHIVDLESVCILKEKRIGRLLEFLSGYTVSPKKNINIYFNWKEICYELSEGRDCGCDIKKVFLDKGMDEYEAYHYFCRFFSDRYERIKKREDPVEICVDGIFDSPISRAVAVLYTMPGFVLEEETISSLMAFLYGYLFGIHISMASDVSEVNVEDTFRYAKAVVEELQALAGNCPDDEQGWNMFFAKYEMELEKRGESLEKLFLRKKKEYQGAREQHWFW